MLIGIHARSATGGGMIIENSSLSVALWLGRRDPVFLEEKP